MTHKRTLKGTTSALNQLDRYRVFVGAALISARIRARIVGWVEVNRVLHAIYRNPSTQQAAKTIGFGLWLMGFARAQPVLRSIRNPLPRRRAIQRHIERQYIHARLAEQAEKPALRVLLDKLPDAIFGHIAGFRNTGNLEQSGIG